MASLNDSIGGANLIGTGYSHTSGMHCDFNSAIYVNKNNLQAPSGVYFSGDFTLITWIYLMSFQINSRIIDFGNENYSDNIMLALGASTGLLKAQLNYNSTTGSQIITGSTILNLNQWYHIAYTLGGTSHSIYVNGIQKVTGTTVYVPRNVNRSINYIGWSNDVVIDNLKIYQKGFSADQVMSDYTASLNGISFKTKKNQYKTIHFISSYKGSINNTCPGRF